MLPSGLADLQKSLEAGIKKKKLEGLREPILAAAEPCVLLYEGSQDDIGIGEVHEILRKEDPTIPAKFNKVNMKELLEKWEARKSQPAVGATYVGGLPDLPPGVAWPARDGKKLPFICQLDLASLPTFEGNPLTREGLLLLFAAANDDFPPAVSAVYYTGPRDQLARATKPADDEVVKDWIGKTVYKVIPIVGAELAVSLPGYGSDWWDSLQFENDKQEDRLIRLIDTLNPSDRYANRGGVAAQVLGHMSFPDASPQDAVTYGRREGDDWMSLVQVQSVGSMSWSDEGLLVFSIRRSDLAKGNFGGAYAAVYSS
jgi:uncharacterized protein YwqG